MCVPYGMWGLKTQQVIQSEITILFCTEGFGGGGGGSINENSVALELCGKYVSLQYQLKIPEMP